MCACDAATLTPGPAHWPHRALLACSPPTLICNVCTLPYLLSLPWGARDEAVVVCVRRLVCGLTPPFRGPGLFQSGTTMLEWCCRRVRCSLDTSFSEV